MLYHFLMSNRPTCTITGSFRWPQSLILHNKCIKLRGKVPVESPYISYTLTGYYRSDYLFVITSVDTLRPHLSYNALRRDIPNLFIGRFETSVSRGHPVVREEWFPPKSSARHFIHFDLYHALWRVHDSLAVWDLDSNEVKATYTRLMKDPLAYCFTRVPPLNTMVPVSNVEPFLDETIPTIDRQCSHYLELLLNSTIYHKDPQTSLAQDAIPAPIRTALLQKHLIVLNDGMMTATFVDDTMKHIQTHSDVVLTNTMPTTNESDVVLDATALHMDVNKDATKIIVTNGSSLDAEQYLRLLSHPAPLVVVGDPRCLRAPYPRWGMPPLPIPTNKGCVVKHIHATDNLLMDLQNIYKDVKRNQTLHCVSVGTNIHMLNNMIKDVGGKLLYFTSSGNVSQIQSVRDVPKGSSRGTEPPQGVMSTITRGCRRKVVFKNKEVSVFRHATPRYAMATTQWFGEPVHYTLVVWAPGMTSRHIQTLRNRTLRKMIVLSEKKEDI